MKNKKSPESVSYILSAIFCNFSGEECLRFENVIGARIWGITEKSGQESLNLDFN